MRVLFLLCVSLVQCAFVFSQTYPSGKIILDKVDENMSAKTRIITAKMEIESGRGIRTMVSKTWSEGDDKAFTEYLAPAREKGTKMLKLGGQLWLYSPITDRVIQISGHMLRQSVMGSDMSYEEMMNDTPLLERYTAQVSGNAEIDGRACWVVTLTAITKDVSYFTQQMWVDKQRYVPLRAELYGKSGKLLKRISFSDIQKVQNRWFPFVIVYKDMLKEGKGTTMKIESINFDVALPTMIFNKSGLR